MSIETALLTKLLQPTKQIVNYCSDGSIIYSLYANGTDMNFKTALCGALTADILSPVLSISGSGGVVSWLSVLSMDTTIRTMRVKVTVDGIVVFDATTGSLTNVAQGLQVIGGGRSASYTSNNDIPVVFNNTLLVEVASSITETDKFKIGYRYQLK